jgi:hypothetical protein
MPAQVPEEKQDKACNESTSLYYVVVQKQQVLISEMG